MDKDDYFTIAIVGVIASVFFSLFAASYYDSAAQRQCREKLAVAPAQYRSAADIALICK